MGYCNIILIKYDNNRFYSSEYNPFLSFIVQFPLFNVSTFFNVFPYFNYRTFYIFCKKFYMYMEYNKSVYVADCPLYL